MVEKRQKKRVNKNYNPYSQINWEKAIKLFQEISPQTDKRSSYPQVKQILHLLAAAGSIGLIFAFPGAAPALGALALGGQSFDRWKTKEVLKRMRKQKLVKVLYHEDGRVTVKITKNGMVRALSYELNNLQLKVPKIWDRKWRLVIFDMPEKYKNVRDIFRDRLEQLGLYQLQKSVYVSPYPCFNEIEFLRELYGVAFTIKYLLVERIEDDEELREHYRLYR